MSVKIEPAEASCGAFITGIDLSAPLSAEGIAELRAVWLTHKVLAFPNQQLADSDLERVTLYFGAFGEDPFFGHIDGHPNIAAIQRNADETTPVFAEIFHSDWSFLEVPPAGTMLYSITIPPHGGNTLFANQVAAYEALPPRLKEKADGLTAIHSAALGYAPDGAYGEDDKNAGRSMKIVPSERAHETHAHPFVRTHPETGEKALYSSAAYIVGFEGIAQEDTPSLLAEFYHHQIKDEFVYSHKWEKDMLVMWDNRSLLHSATGGYDGYNRLLHRTTIADTRF